MRAGLAWHLLGAAGAFVLMAGCVTPQQHYALERSVAELKEAQRTDSGPGDTRVAELGSQLEGLRQEVAALRGRVEQAEHLAEQATRQPRVAQAPAESPKAPAFAVPPQGESLTDEVRAYEEAFAVYRANDYAKAIDRFSAFLQTYPSSDHSDNALFWKGECFFKLGDFERSVLTFEDVIKRFPDGNKVPDALLRQGIALEEIGKQDQDKATYDATARQIFQRILRDYPQSERVPEAQRQLEKLGQ